MNIRRRHINTKVVEISVALVGLLPGTSFTHAQENSTRPETSRLRLKVVTTLPQPVIGRNTPGTEMIPGGFEGGSSVKVTIDGKSQYHFFAQSEIDRRVRRVHPRKAVFL